MTWPVFCGDLENRTILSESLKHQKNQNKHARGFSTFSYPVTPRTKCLRSYDAISHGVFSSHGSGYEHEKSNIMQKEKIEAPHSSHAFLSATTQPLTVSMLKVCPTDIVKCCLLRSKRNTCYLTRLVMKGHEDYQATSYRKVRNVIYGHTLPKLP